MHFPLAAAVAMFDAAAAAARARFVNTAMTAAIKEKKKLPPSDHHHHHTSTPGRIKTVILQKAPKNEHEELHVEELALNPGY